MSVFIRVERYGAEPRVLRLRGLATCIGEDERGVLTSEHPVRPFFHVYAADEDSFVEIVATGIHRNAEKVEPKERHRIDPRDVLHGHGYRWRIIRTAALAEVAAQTGINPDRVLFEGEGEGEPRSHLTLTLAGLRKSVPLFREIEIAIGSSERAPFHLDLPGIASVHCTVRRTADRTLLIPEAGSVSLAGALLKEPTEICGSGSFELEPLGIHIQFTC